MPSAAPDHLALRLPAHAYYQLIHTLRLALPPPPGVKPGPDELLRRDHAAIARIAALVPANAAEADLAAQFVAASEQWKDCLRLAQAPETTPEWAAKCRAQAASMMRQANSALRLLLRLQEAREKREAANAGCDRAAWTEHCAIGLMAEALAPDPHPNPLPAGEGAPPLLPVPLGEGRGEGEPDVMAEAEHYAVIYPERAALIRALGRVPDDVSFGPPDDELVQALVTSRASVPLRDPVSRLPHNETATRMPWSRSSPWRTGRNVGNPA